MKLVIVESPFAAPDQRGLEEHLEYARDALADCLSRGEAPFASHLLYTQPGVLDDTKPEERALGIEAGLLWGQCAGATIVYYDLGVSRGMDEGIRRASIENRTVEWRSLPSWEALVQDGEVKPSNPLLFDRTSAGKLPVRDSATLALRVFRQVHNAQPHHLTMSTATVRLLALECGIELPQDSIPSSRFFGLPIVLDETLDPGQVKADQ